MIVWLVGYMGSGKSSIGRRVARSAGYGFIDTDREVEQKAGASVAEIFEREGEAKFRRLEREVLEEVAGGARGIAENAETGESGGPEGVVVVATGGGMPCFGDNMEYMNRTGLTIYLRSGVERLAARLGPGRERRPLLKGMDDEALAAYVGSNMRAREEFYMRAAAVIECDGACDDYVVRQIAGIAAQYCGLERRKASDGARPPEEGGGE